MPVNPGPRFPKQTKRDEMRNLIAKNAILVSFVLGQIAGISGVLLLLLVTR